MSAWQAALLGFGLGSVPFGFILVRLVRGQDVRAVGSGNIGATNVGRVLGPRGAAMTLALDAAKGAAAVVATERLGGDSTAVAAAGLGAILGHCYTPWLGFRGGKGVATMLGTFLALEPLAVAGVAAVFVAVAGITRFVSLASLLAASSLAPAAWWLGAPPPTVMVAAATFLVVLLRHRDNVRRLLAGTEAKIGRKVG